MEADIYKESQQFRQCWLWIILLAIAAIPLWGIVQQIFLNEPFGDRPMTSWGLMLFAVFTLALVLFFWSLKLTTFIDKGRIQLKFNLLAERMVTWEEVQSVEVVKYGFVGYGIRFGSKHGIVYNVSGNKGLAIVLTNGKKFLVGTQNENELEAYLKRCHSDKMKSD